MINQTACQIEGQALILGSLQIVETEKCYKLIKLMVQEIGR